MTDLDALASYQFELPEERIAQRPLEDRAGARLLVVRDKLEHKHVRDLAELVKPGDVVVVNDTTVIPARLFGEKAGTGGKVEVLLVRPASTSSSTWVCLVNASKKPKPGTRIVFGTGQAHAIDAFFATVEDAIEDEPGAFLVKFDGDPVLFARSYGHVPLPPYIARDDDDADVDRYQTVFHDDNKPGSSAAPTAGLHFDDALLERIRNKGAAVAKVTLHVGPGTFLPVREAALSAHQMHPEPWFVDEKAAMTIARAKRDGGRVIAVGTTSLRCLESASDDDGNVAPGSGLTRLFIKPGYRWKTVDALVTNFHLPGSTLFVLVCAFAGYDKMRAAYDEAIRAGYRFYSYGDASFLLRA